MSRKVPNKKNVEILKIFMAHRQEQLRVYKKQEKKKRRNYEDYVGIKRLERKEIDKRFNINMDEKNAWGHHVTYINDNSFLLEWTQVSGIGNIPGTRTIRYHHRYVDRKTFMKWLKRSKNEFILSMI